MHHNSTLPIVIHYADIHTGDALVDERYASRTARRRSSRRCPRDYPCLSALSPTGHPTEEDVTPSRSEGTSDYPRLCGCSLEPAGRVYDVA